MPIFTYQVMKDDVPIGTLAVPYEATLAVVTWRDQKFERGEWRKVEPFIVNMSGAVDEADADARLTSDIAFYCAFKGEILPVRAA